MKPRFLLALSSIVLPLAPQTGLRAADFNWSGASVVNSDWSSRFNWSPSTAPPLSDTTTNLTFAGGTRTTPNAQAPYTLRSILFSGTTASFNLSGSTLTLAGSGPFVRNASGNNHTVQNTLSFSNGGNIRAQSANLTVTGQTLVPAGTLTLQADTNRAITTATVGGAGNLSKTGGGTLNLSGLTALGGTLSMSAGTVSLGNSLSATGGFTSFTGSSLLLNSHSAGFGPFEGSGQINLGSGLLTINQSTNSSTTSTFLGTTGALTKTGTGTLSVGGAMSHGGTTTVNGGILRATAPFVFSSTSPHQIGPSGILDLNGHNQSISSLSGTGTATLGTARLFYGNANDSVWSGTFTGDGEIVKVGNGTLTIETNQSHSGGTLINGGTIFLRHSGGLGTTSSPTEITLSTTLRLESGLSLAPDRTITLAGVGHLLRGAIRFESTDGQSGVAINSSLVLNGDSSITHANPVGTMTLGSTSNPRTIDIGSHQLSFLGEPGSGAIRINHVLSGSGKIVQNSPKTLALAANSGAAYQGPVDVLDGTLRLESLGALGVGSNPIDVSPGATLEVDESLAFSSARQLLLGGALSGRNGSIWAGTGEINITSETAKFDAIGTGASFLVSGIGGITGPGRLTLDASSGQTITVERGLTMTGPTSGLTKTGTGLAILGGTGPATYTGPTSVQAGILRYASPGRLPAASRVSVSTGATLDLNSFIDSIDSLSGSGSVTLGSGTLNLQPASDNSFTGEISGTGRVVVFSSAGAQNFASENTYTGGTEIRSLGKLRASTDGAIGTGRPLLIESGGWLDIFRSTQTVSSLSGAGLIIFSGSAPKLVLDLDQPMTWLGTISGPGELVKSGIHQAIFTHAANHTGPTRIGQGIMQMEEGAPSSHVIIESETASFYGNGSFAQITTAGNLYPGRLAAPVVGNMTVTGPVALQPGGSLRFDIQNWDGNPGTGHDVIDCTTLAFNGIVTNPNQIIVNLPASLTNFSETPRVFKLVRASTGNITGFLLGANATFNTLNQSNESPQGAWSLRISNGDLEAVYTPAGSDTYPSWVGGFDLPGQDAPGDDPDADGIPNAIEYVLGGDPKEVDDSDKLPTSTLDNGDLVFVFRRTTRSIYLDPAVHHSTTLQPPWTKAVHGIDGVVITTSPIDSETDEVTVRIPMAGAPRRFARLEVFVP